MRMMTRIQTYPVLSYECCGNPCISAEMDDLAERRQAELDFVEAAYAEDEAWCGNRHQGGGGGDSSLVARTVYRRLETDASRSADERVSFLLQLEMPKGYPARQALHLSGTVQEDRTSSRLVKSAFNALPTLLLACRQVADEQVGEEALFAVLSQADEWIQSEWPSFAGGSATATAPTKGLKEEVDTSGDSVILGRRLIYSHHIISKQKRSDMRELASHYKLTGYVKIGWPGLVILEGLDIDCNAFYDDMRRWAWKYLVVRGEMQERVQNSHELESQRRFPTFLEVDDMSRVANHCRQVGLEALFRTSMKVYQDTEYADAAEYCDAPLFGALVHVDHMNDAKTYRKWLRKTCQDIDVSLLIKQWYPNHDFSKRPKIVVGIMGDHESVSSVLKRWRTSRVDVDSRGKPCLERMMSVLAEGDLDKNPSSEIDWDTASADDRVNITREDALELLGSLGGPLWLEAVQDL